MAEGGPECTDGKCHNTVVLQYDQIEDSFIHSGLPNNNLGSDAALLIDDNDLLAQYITFIKPTSLGNLPIGAGATIVNARLELTCYNSDNNFGVHLVIGAWTESTITWNNAPTFTASSSAELRERRHRLSFHRSTEHSSVGQRPRIVFTYY
jgi:hypothetical protein